MPLAASLAYTIRYSSIVLPVETNKNVSRHCQMPSGPSNPQLGRTYLENRKSYRLEIWQVKNVWDLFQFGLLAHISKSTSMPLYG